MCSLDSQYRNVTKSEFENAYKFESKAKILRNFVRINTIEW